MYIWNGNYYFDILGCEYSMIIYLDKPAKLISLIPIKIDLSVSDL